MRNSILIILMIPFVFSCKKYEDGPNFSLKSEEARLTSKWEVQAAYYTAFTDLPQNGEVQTEFWRDFTVEFKDDKTYSISHIDFGTEYVENGTWQFSDDLTLVQTTGLRQEFDIETEALINQYNNNTTWRIMRLKKKELWVWYQEQTTQPWVYFELTRVK